MGGVMLILSSVRMHRAVTRMAVDEAKDSGKDLVILSVLDRAIPTKVAEQFAESGQIGSRPSEGFLDSLYARHELLALEQAEDVVTEARRQGIGAVSDIRRGDYAAETAAAITEQRPEVVVIEKRKRSLLRFATEDAFIDELRTDVGFALIEA